MDYKEHRIEVARKNLRLAELENFEWPEIARLQVHLCIKCERFLYALETNALTVDETDVMFMFLRKTICLMDARHMLEEVLDRVLFFSCLG